MSTALAKSSRSNPKASPSASPSVRPPPSRYFATKGSAAIDGVSLTVAAALPNGDFQVAIIPHTWDVTTLSTLKAGTKVNLEIDMLARYVARMIGADAPQGS